MSLNLLPLRAQVKRCCTSRGRPSQLARVLEEARTCSWVEADRLWDPKPRLCRATHIHSLLQLALHILKRNGKQTHFHHRLSPDPSPFLGLLQTTNTITEHWRINSWPVNDWWGLWSCGGPLLKWVSILTNSNRNTVLWEILFFKIIMLHYSTALNACFFT